MGPATSHPGGGKGKNGVKEVAEEKKAIGEGTIYVTKISKKRRAQRKSEGSEVGPFDTCQEGKECLENEGGSKEKSGLVRTEMLRE